MLPDSMKKDISKEQFQSNMAAAALPVAVAATGLGEMAVEKAILAGSGKRVATEAFEYETVDKDGKTKTEKVPKGKEFNRSSIPDEYKDVAKKSSNVQSTRVTKMVSGALRETGDLFNSISPLTKTKEPLDSPNNDSDTKNDPNKDGEVDKKTKHGDSSKVDSKESVPKKPETIKPEAKLEATNAKIAELASTSNGDLGRSALSEIVQAKLDTTVDPKERTQLLQLNNDIKGGKDINVGQLRGAGFDKKDFSDLGIVSEHKESEYKDKKTGEMVSSKKDAARLISSGSSLETVEGLYEKAGLSPESVEHTTVITMPAGAM